MLLLIAHAGSDGGSSFCLERMRECLRSGERVRLLTPTTTLAEHLRNQLAREGFVFSPKLVSTFGKYVDGFVSSLSRPNDGLLEVIVAEVLDRLSLKRYGAVREFEGFRSAVVRAIEEFEGAGGAFETLVRGEADPDFRLVYQAVSDELKNRGLYLRGERLRAAAEAMAHGAEQGTVLLAGFSGFTPPELAVIRALDGHSRLTVTISAGSPAEETLRCMAADRHDLPPRERTGTHVLCVATGIEEEAVEIARRIVQSGVPFRSIGVILRSEQPYAAAIRCAFERFGIAARFYFAQDLERAAVVRYFRALVDAALSGWDHGKTLAALRMHGSPLERTPTGDRFEFDVQERIPQRGFDALRSTAPEWCHQFFDELAKLDGWRTAEAPGSVWAERFSELVSLFRPPQVTDRVAHATALLWREHAAAIQQFRAALSEAAVAIPGKTTCREFVGALDAIIRATSVHIVDHRTDVVHVLDAVEARQWKLSLVFVPGMIEQHFPRYHSEDPVLPDAVRARLQRQGVPLRTSGERQAEERALFDAALASAEDSICLSYPRLNEKGEPNLRSFLLDRARPYSEETAQRAMPRPHRARATEPYPSINDESLRQYMAGEHRSINPSKIERYLDCRYGYFAEHVLKLKEAPCGPWDRLDPRVQGTIAHAVFQTHYSTGMPVADAFDIAFEAECGKQGVPAGYRTEAIRLELLDAVTAFVKSCNVPQLCNTKYEHVIDLQIPQTEIRLKGRVDRIEADARGRALLIDYKYSAGSRVKEIVAAHENREAAQAGAYLLGVEKDGFEPVGVVFCSIREGYVGGWVREPYHPELGIKSSATTLDDLKIAARELAIRMVEDLSAGRIAPDEVAGARCRRCSYLEICRNGTVVKKVAQ